MSKRFSELLTPVTLKTKQLKAVHKYSKSYITVQAYIETNIIYCQNFLQATLPGGVDS